MFNLFFGKKVRTRFAPSPTGYLHVGGLRTALYAYLFARQKRGVFILRLEDTDQSREVAGAADNLLKSLAWAGLMPDEGLFLTSDGKVAQKGHFGPYQQSQRVKIYRQYAQKLVDAGHAYYCFCTPERLETLRHTQEAAGQPTHYDWLCRSLTPEEIKTKLDRGDKYVIRLKVPEKTTVAFNDWVRGQVKVDSREIDDQVLVKSDGFPTYHLANVVDDHLMKITHVIRGEEWLPSTPKHLLLYQFFGWLAPQFIHLPLILNPDKSKLSKRQGDVAVEDYRMAGYLPEAIINFVALLGWNPGDEREIFSLGELAKIFDLKKVHKAGAVFDWEKLDWLNGEYLKKLPLTKFIVLARPYLDQKISGQKFTEEYLNKILALEQSRIKKLNEIGEGMDFFLVDQLSYDAQLLVWKKSDLTATKNNLALLVTELKKYPAGDWNEERLERKLLKFVKDNKLTNGEVLWPLRVALTGQEKSPPPFAVAAILGQEKTLERLEAATEKI